MHTIGRQVGWALGTRNPAAVAARLAELGLAPHVAQQYPHQLSSGMRKRVAMVRTLAQDPDVLIAESPPTTLDSLPGRPALPDRPGPSAPGAWASC